ncbi:MAG: quinone-dependent dihydroorotate dehydrogenase [Proteobacteria bacterium]|nr:quinone-dependent dihydroorotate dehydrogenase [Pseudomonadota bacterium]
MRPMLFALDAEKAHERTLKMLGRRPDLFATLANISLGPPPAELAFEAFGLSFKGPVGLAAGLDKNGVAIPFWPSTGFGFLEVGTVTRFPQPGNEKPRLFRIPSEKALINRMGFNNQGSERLARRLRTLKVKDQWPDIPLGVNIGKSKITTLEDACEDYVFSTRCLVGLADFFTINVSSPNTPGLRDLQNEEWLKKLLPSVVEAAQPTPVLLKLAPDLADEALARAVELALAEGISGIVATNTTIRRDLLRSDPNQMGGMSGAPLWPFARGQITKVLAAASGRVPVIGVGGISSGEQARELLDAGCIAVQILSALVFEGPGLPKRLNQHLQCR